MRLLANENVPLASVATLRLSGHDVIAVAEESPGERDSAILARGAAENRVIITFDRDYGELVFHRRLGPPAGIVYLRFDPLTPEEPAEYLLHLTSMEGLSFEGKFTVVTQSQVRQRTLPAPK